MEKKYKVIYGGWHQRTFIHLAEVYEFFNSGSSELGLDQKKLKKYHGALKLKSVKKESENLDYIKAETENGICVKYFEDGLYSLELESDNINTAQKSLQNYYNDRLNPAISYIFSLGAPTSGKLTDSRSHPTIILTEIDSVSKFEFPSDQLGSFDSLEDYENAHIYRLSGKTLVVTEKREDQLAYLEIFLDESYHRLRSYLNLHRKVWEDIAEIKSRTAIKGTEVEKLRERLDDYQKITNMVTNRIDQMEIFISSRKILANSMNLNKELNSNFELRFNSLVNTSTYSNKLWKMTDQYLDSAISNIVEIQDKSTVRGLRSLQLVLSISIIASIIGYLSRDALPKVTLPGFVFLILVILIAWAANLGVNRLYQAKKYSLKSDKNFNL